MNKDESMSVIVRTVANLLFCFIIVYGLYIIMHGHLSPGGGFQGGVIIAASAALLFVAYGYKFADEKYSEKGFTFLKSAGALAFTGLAFAGIGIAFFYNIFWHEQIVLYGPPGTLFSAGIIPFMNFAVGTKVLAGIVIGVFTLGLFQMAKGETDGDGREEGGGGAEE